MIPDSNVILKKEWQRYNAYGIVTRHKATIFVHTAKFLDMDLSVLLLKWNKRLMLLHHAYTSLYRKGIFIAEGNLKEGVIFWTVMSKSLTATLQWTMHSL